MAEARDLVTMLYRPRETMRRVLDSPNRWTNGLIALASVCTSFPDADIRHMPRELPGLGLTTLLAIVTLGIIMTVIFWILAMYLIAWLVTVAGRFLEGNATVADVHAALAWAAVPMVWSIIGRLPLGIYTSSLAVRGNAGLEIALDMLGRGTLSILLIVIAIKLVFVVWVVWLAAINLSEAMQFETWKGLSAMAAVAAVPFVVAAAVVLSRH